MPSPRTQRKCGAEFQFLRFNQQKSLEQQPRNGANAVRRIGLIGHQRSVEQRSSLCHSHLRLSVHCRSTTLATAFVLYTFVYFVPTTSRYVVSLLWTTVRCIVIDCSVLRYAPKLLKVVGSGRRNSPIRFSHAMLWLDGVTIIDDVIMWKNFRCTMFALTTYRQDGELINLLSSNVLCTWAK